MDPYKERKLQEWFDSLTPEQLRKVAEQAVGELIFTDDLRFYPDQAEDVEALRGPYWDSSGTTIGETE